MARSRLWGFSLPFPPPLWVWFAFAGKFDASLRFFIGTGKKKKKKKEEGETSPAEARGLHSLSLPPCHFTELLDFLLLLLLPEMGQRNEPSCPPLHPSIACPCKAGAAGASGGNISPSPAPLPPKATPVSASPPFPAPGLSGLQGTGKGSTEGQHLRSRLPCGRAVFAPLPLVI